MKLRLNIVEDPPYKSRVKKRKIIKTLDNLIIKLYCFIRFLIIPLRIIESIGQFVPEDGWVLDLGCGFGFFTLFYCINHPNTHFIGIDLSKARIAIAKKSAQRLGITNVEFIQGDARTEIYKLRGIFNLIFSVDLFHHISIEDGNKLANYLHHHLLEEKGVWVIKDVTTRPRSFLYFTFLLDWMMNPFDSFYYRNLSVWKALSANIGYTTVETYEVWDIFPYPHFLLVARK